MYNNFNLTCWFILIQDYLKKCMFIRFKLNTLFAYGGYYHNLCLYILNSFGLNIIGAAPSMLLYVVANVRIMFIIAKCTMKLSHFKFSNRIFFRNKHGMQWSGKVYQWKDGRILICEANHGSLDDWCICEFPQGNNQEVNVIDVLIFCSGKEAS